jgi:CheY-like chemotaxis protein
MRKQENMITKCCLFIDNDPYSQAIFTRALTDLSPETICFTAANGIDGLYMMLEERVIPSYIFIELDLPRMGGLAFLREIKGKESLKEIPVIVHTTSPQPHQIIELKELGAHAIYFRPYEYYGVCNLLTLYFSQEMAGIQPN